MFLLKLIALNFSVFHFCFLRHRHAFFIAGIDQERTNWGLLTVCMQILLLLFFFVLESVYLASRIPATEVTTSNS